MCERQKIFRNSFLKDGSTAHKVNHSKPIITITMKEIAFLSRYETLLGPKQERRGCPNLFNSLKLEC